MSASIDAYRTVSQGTASPRRVILKCYDAATRFLAEAEDAIEAGEPAGEPLTKARTVVGGLMTALNFEAGEMAQNLLRVYLFVLDRIHSTTTEGRDTGLAPARRALEILHGAWEQMPADEARRGSIAAASRATGLDLKG